MHILMDQSISLCLRAYEKTCAPGFIHWRDRDRGIVYSRQKSRDKASLFSAIRSSSVRRVTLILSRVIRDRRRRSSSLLGEPVSVDRSIVEATTSEIPNEFSNCRSSLCDKMKTFHIAFVAACLIACAYTYPSQPNNEEDDLDNLYNFSFPIIPDFSGLFSDAMRSMNHMRQNFLNYFWNMPDFTNIPKGANTTSTVKIIDGHKVTINETTYVSNDTDSNVAFIIRTIDVQPEDAILNNTGPTTVKAEAPGSREEVDLNNEISKNTDDLSA